MGGCWVVIVAGAPWNNDDVDLFLVGTVDANDVAGLAGLGASRSVQGWARMPAPLAGTGDFDCFILEGSRWLSSLC